MTDDFLGDGVWLQRKLSERSTQPLSPEWQSGYAGTWQVKMELAHALPRTRGEPWDIRQLKGSGIAEL